MMILIAGPYRSGTDDDPARMAANMPQLEAVALPLFQAGHLPMIGEWVALPLPDAVRGETPATGLGYASSVRLLVNNWAELPTELLNCWRTSRSPQTCLGRFPTAPITPIINSCTSACQNSLQKVPEAAV